MLFGRGRGDFRLFGALGGGEVVLVIDDEPTIRMLIGEVLAESGYSVIEAPDGPAGLKVLESTAKKTC